MSTSWVGRAVETVVPQRLGRDYRWLLGSSWLSNLGDGIIMAAGPLLVEALTDNAQLVALSATLAWLPPLLFSLVAGITSDRVDRWSVLLAGNVLRIVVLGALAVLLLTGHASIPIVLTSMFLLGCAEVFVDNTSSTLVPMLVRKQDLAVANSRIMAGFVTVNQLAGPPLGAAIFAIGYAWPVVSQVLLVIAAVLMLSRVRIPKIERATEPTHIRHDLAEGLRWTWAHPAVRTLLLTIFTFNITFGAAWSVMVVYAKEQLGLGEVGYGLTITASALGGLIGTSAYGWLTRRMRLGVIMRIGLIIETLTHIALAITHTPWVAMVVFFVFGAHAFVWGTTSTTVRQRVVPTALQGRVTGVYSLGVFGGLVMGSVLGGYLAERFDVAWPFWFAGIGSAIFVVAIWSQLRHIDHDDDEAAAEQNS